jgi:hypothetical protein
MLDSFAGHAVISAFFYIYLLVRGGHKINISSRYVYYPINTYIRIALIDSLIDFLELAASYRYI